MITSFFGGAFFGGEFFNGISAPPAAVAGGRASRRRYLLPDNTLVWATPEEIREVLAPVIEPPKPHRKAKKARKVAHEPFVPIQFEAVPDMNIETYRPTLPKLRLIDLKQVSLAAERLRRRIDDEDAIILLL